MMSGEQGWRSGEGACFPLTWPGFKSWRVFLKRAENFSGLKAFRGSFRVIFLGPGKRFSKHPKTARIRTRVFRIVFSGELDSDWFKNLIELTPLH